MIQQGASVTATNQESWVEWMKGSSIWKGPVLALLLDGPAHSYELSRRLWVRLGPEWHRPSKDIYRLLNEAEGLGLAVSTRQASSARARTDIRVYEATEETPAAVDFWMEQPLPREPLRSVLTARMMLSRKEHIPLVLRALDEYEEFLLKASRAHSTPYPKTSYVNLEKEAARKAVVKQVKAGLDWVEETRADIKDFQAKHRA